MSMAEPFLPRPSDADAEPEVGVPDEPDVLPSAEDEPKEEGSEPGDTPFRTPLPGQRLTADQLDEETSSE